ncbi:MAG: mandelate racemase/muconate lactonizing enzyme family protein [Litorilinea sp.]
MKITAVVPEVVHVNHRGDWIFVVVETDAGITGVGEASHSGNDALLLPVIRHFNDTLAGQDPRSIEAIWTRLARMDGGRIVHTALSGLEQALWDILGQHLNTPVHTLFGGAMRDRLRLYANINRHVTDRSPAGFAKAARQAADEGFTAVKLAPFDELVQPDHIRTGPKAAWRNGVARVEAVRQAIGDEIELAVDCHGRMDAGEALIVADALAACNLYWYEEPVPDSYLDELAGVTAAVRMPTASAESIFGMEGFRPFFQRHIVDVLMPDVKHDGGLMETKRIAGAARMCQLLVAPHNPAGPLATAATAQVISTVSNFSILEYAWGEVDWRADLLDPPERIEDGYLVLSQEPGLGHRLNAKTVASHRAQAVSSQDSAKAKPKST